MVPLQQMKVFSTETNHSMEFMVIGITQRENVTHGCDVSS